MENVNKTDGTDYKALIIKLLDRIDSEDLLVEIYWFVRRLLS